MHNLLSLTKDLQFVGFFPFVCGFNLLSVVKVCSQQMSHGAFHSSVFLFKGLHYEAGIKFWNMSTHCYLPVSKKPS